jgi:hypothetical protein
MRAYVLAGGLEFIAAAAWAALPSPDNPVETPKLVRPDFQAANDDLMLRPCCDPWRDFDRFGQPERVERTVENGFLPAGMQSEWALMRGIRDGEAPRLLPIELVLNKSRPASGARVANPLRSQ